MTILLTGVAGFIGYHVAEALLARRSAPDRIRQSQRLLRSKTEVRAAGATEGTPRFHLSQGRIAERESVNAVLDGIRDTEFVIHLAAQAGVRHSLVDPYAYVQST